MFEARFLKTFKKILTRKPEMLKTAVIEKKSKFKIHKRRR